MRQTEIGASGTCSSAPPTVKRPTTELQRLIRRLEEAYDILSDVLKLLSGAARR